MTLQMYAKHKGLDLALAAAAFDQPLNVLFTGEGVLQLLPGLGPATARKAFQQLAASGFEIASLAGFAVPASAQLKLLPMSAASSTTGADGMATDTTAIPGWPTR